MPFIQLNSLFSSPSFTSFLSPLFSSSSSSSATPAQSEKESSKPDTTSSTCKRASRQRRNGATASVFLLVFLDLWGVVPIIILITTTGTPSTVSAVSIAAVSFNSNAYGDSKGSGSNSGNLDKHHQPGKGGAQPSKLSFILSGNDAKGKGNGSSAGVLNLPFGELHFTNKLDQQQEHQMDMEAIKHEAINGEREQRSVGDTRITSNQDVSTLALAVDNSSSVAIANINSSYNTVFVSIGSSNFPTRYDPNSYPPSDEDEDDKI